MHPLLKKIFNEDLVDMICRMTMISPNRQIDQLIWIDMSTGKILVNGAYHMKNKNKNKLIIMQASGESSSVSFYSNFVEEVLEPKCPGDIGESVSMEVTN